MKKIITFILLIIPLFSLAENLPVNLIKLPPGFHISLYAQDIPNARQLALGPDGIVFVGTRKDKVYALIPKKPNNFSAGAKVITIASGLNAPNGVAYHDGALYVAEFNRLLKYNDIIQHLSRPLRPQNIASLPDKRWHGYRYIKFGPDGWLYMGIGAPCNVCISKNKLFGTIVRMKANGTDMQIYATGVRNSVGFAWDPRTKHLWFTDNGRDWLGDKLPPDELNYAPKAGMNFGFPFVYGDNIPDPIFGKDIPKDANFTPPAWGLPAHVANLGMIFYTGKMFPKKYHDQIFIAEHGSWNRSKKIGYRVSMITLKNNKASAYTPIFTGWLQGQKAWGRPVDLLVLPDGSLLISDDYAGVVYRVSYQKTRPQATEF